MKEDQKRVRLWNCSSVVGNLPGMLEVPDSMSCKTHRCSCPQMTACIWVIPQREECCLEIKQRISEAQWIVGFIHSLDMFYGSKVRIGGASHLGGWGKRYVGSRLAMSCSKVLQQKLTNKANTYTYRRHRNHEKKLFPFCADVKEKTSKIPWWR